MTDYQYVVISGNPVDGIVLHGPFIDGEQANGWADEHLNNASWWVTTLEDPETQRLVQERVLGDVREVPSA